jgi:hypothetical protein
LTATTCSLSVCPPAAAVFKDNVPVDMPIYFIAIGAGPVCTDQILKRLQTVWCAN